MVYYTDFQILRQTCIPEIIQFFVYIAELFANILLWIFVSIFIKDVGLLMSFFLALISRQ